jgi:predicted helicase
MNHLKNYLAEIVKTKNSKIAGEHAYRGFLQNLLHQILPEEIRAINEPAKVDWGKPDLALVKNEIQIGYIETKDLGDKLNLKKDDEQFERYRNAAPNLVISNYLDFWFFFKGKLIAEVAIAKIENSKLVFLPENFDEFIARFENFSLEISQSLNSPQSLAALMAKKAKLLAIAIEKALIFDQERNIKNSLTDEIEAFKDILIKDIKPKQFADLYAQTITYGMFAARLHDQSLNSFSRQKAADLIPKTNPFLRKLFAYVAGPDLDERLVQIVDDLAQVFCATDLGALLQNFGAANNLQDPIIHFYETFLSQYDPALRKSHGVWYTPQAIVNFIVRAVDEVLIGEFGLKHGIASTNKVSKEIFSQEQNKPITQEFHKVQILDPATGTGTFLCEVIRQIHAKFQGQPALWQTYVDEHLISRLNGFEILMASYAMAHLKLDLLLTETGYKSKPTQDSPSNAKQNARFKVFLTNSLEENFKVAELPFAKWLSAEANQANQIKRDAPVMVILGNPPYSGESQNKSEWIMKLMEDYKKEPNSTQKLAEKNPKWINDDYVKFLRFGQYFIEKNGEGILAFINSHGFLDNPTFRSVRFSLLKTYDKIYTIDLHGNSKKKETAPQGEKDETVFDIQQGVSINIFVKNGAKKAGCKNPPRCLHLQKLQKEFHANLRGGVFGVFVEIFQ